MCLGREKQRVTLFFHLYLFPFYIMITRSVNDSNELAVAGDRSEFGDARSSWRDPHLAECL